MLQFVLVTLELSIFSQININTTWRALWKLATGWNGSRVRAVVWICGKLSLVLLARTHACNGTTLPVKTGRQVWIPTQAEEWERIHLHLNVLFFEQQYPSTMKMYLEIQIQHSKNWPFQLYNVAFFYLHTYIPTNTPITKCVFLDGLDFFSVLLHENKQFKFFWISCLHCHRNTGARSQADLSSLLEQGHQNVLVASRNGHDRPPLICKIKNKHRMESST